MTKLIHDPVKIARQFAFVRETLGPNRGVFVEAIQRIGDGKPGDSWCADFVSMVFYIAYQGKPPVLPRTGSCDIQWVAVKHLEVKLPIPGDLFYRVRVGTNDAHHVGIVTRSEPLTAIAGNTSEDGKSSNGTGVFENKLTITPEVRFIRIPTEG